MLSISVDSVYCHFAFAVELGGINFPMLSDFHPKGKVVMDYGLWREDKGHSRRTVVVIDPEGIVRWVKVILKGRPDLDEVLVVIRALHV